jgi:hypothetical protein
MPPEEAGEAVTSEVWTINDTREMSASLLAEDGTRVEMGTQDKMEIQFGFARTDGGTWEIQKAYVPRDGNGTELLWVVTVSRKREQ